MGELIGWRTWWWWRRRKGGGGEERSCYFVTFTSGNEKKSPVYKKAETIFVLRGRVFWCLEEI